MDNSFIKFQNKREKRNGAYDPDFRGLNRSNSQPILYRTKDKLNKSYLLRKLKNNYNNDNKSLIFPHLTNNKSQINNSINSSNQNSSFYTKITNSDKKSIRLKLIKQV
jgi:hypothetical protein